jgi:hypothetical protein
MAVDFSRVCTVTLQKSSNLIMWLALFGFGKGAQVEVQYLLVSGLLQGMLAKKVAVTRAPSASATTPSAEATATPDNGVTDTEPIRWFVQALHATGTENLGEDLLGEVAHLATLLAPLEVTSTDKALASLQAASQAAVACIHRTSL